MPKSRSLRSLVIGNPPRNGDRPPSPTLSEATNASALNFGSDGPSKIITRANLKASLQSYENLIGTCASYRAALMTLSKSSAAFADAMETCAGLKGASYESGTRLQAASGLHHLMSNHWHVLAETMDKNFEKPLRQNLVEYRNVVQDRSSSYERALHEKSRIIRETEMGNMKRKGRNLQTFREALTVLQRQVDDLDELKASHYQEIVEHEEEVWDFVQGKVTIVVRSTMDVFDRFTAKASDPILEPMLQSVPDPFDSYGPAPSEDQIFSILPPLSIIGHPSPSPSTAFITPEANDSSWPSVYTNSAGAGASIYPSVGIWAENVTLPSASPSPSTSPSTPHTVTPPSTSRPTSPTGIPRRPNSPGHHSRKSESKLRSVLSVIDESASGGAVPRRSRDDDDRGSDSTVDGAQWATFGIEPRVTSEDTTPRSSFFATMEPPNPYFPPEEQDRSATPVAS